MFGRDYDKKTDNRPLRETPDALNGVGVDMINTKGILPENRNANDED